MADLNAITDEQYGVFCKRLDDLKRRVKEGGIPFEDAMAGVQAVSQEPWKFEDRFSRVMGYPWLSDEENILSWNLLASCSDMVFLPDYLKITATLQSNFSGGKGGYILWEGLPVISDVTEYVVKGIVVFLDEYPKIRIPEEAKGWSVPRKAIEGHLRGFAGHIDFAKPPTGECMFLTGSGKVFWSEVKREDLGETLGILAECQREILTPTTFDPAEMERQLVAAFHECGWPDYPNHNSIEGFFEALPYLLREKWIDWVKLGPEVVAIRDRWMKQ